MLEWISRIEVSALYTQHDHDQPLHTLKAPRYSLRRSFSWARRFSVFGGTSLLEISNNFYSTIIQQLKSDSRALAMHVCSRWIFLAPKWSKNLLCCPWNGPRKVYSDRALSLLPLLTTSVLRYIVFQLSTVENSVQCIFEDKEMKCSTEAWSKNAKSLRPARVSINKKKLAPKQSTRQTFFCALFNFVMANAEIVVCKLINRETFKEKIFASKIRMRHRGGFVGVRQPET